VGESKAVFLSYASEDVEAAQRIADSLKTAGIEVWFDQTELRGGDLWDRQIHEKIHDCRLFIPVISTNTEARDEGYFRREWTLAVARTRDLAEKRPFLVPIVIDSTPEKGASVPEKFHQVQWTRLRGGETTPDFVSRIATLIGSPLSAAHASASIGSRSIPSATPPARWTRIWALALLTLSMATAGGGWLIWRQRSPVSAPAPVVKDEKSVAVLPFVDLSEKHDQEYFGDGMAEALIDLLARIPGLTVIGRTSTFQFKGHNEDLRAIGTKLGVVYIVEGSVRSAGSRIRVTAQLIDARSGAHVWSDSYDHEIGDVLVLQDELAAGIARALQLVVGADGRTLVGTVVNPDAYKLYLRGRFAFDRLDLAGFKEARGYFEQALALDPSFLQSSEWLLSAYGNEWFLGGIPGNVALPRIRGLAEEILQRDPASPLAHAELAWVHAYYDLDRGGTEREIDAVLASKTRNPYALYITGYIASTVGRHDDAARLLHEALAIDPLSPDAYYALSGALANAGDYVGSEKAGRRALEISPSVEGIRVNIGVALLQRHELTAALHEMESETPIGGRDYGLALVQFALGNKAASEAALDRFVRDYGEIFPCQVAEVYAYRGQRDLAFRWLDKSLQVHDLCGIGLETDSWLVSLHDDPRWKVLMNRVQSGSKTGDRN